MTRANPGGQVLFAEYELVTHDKLNRVGQIAQQGLLGLMAEIFANGDWRSGFAGDAFLVSQGSGALEMDVAPGIGFFSDATVVDLYQPSYKAIALAAEETITLDPHDASNPRIDLIYAAPATDDDDAGARTLWDVGAGAATSGSVDNRRVWTSTIAVVKGTPGATPAVPSLPTGALALARVRVPASTGACTIYDERPRLEVGTSWRPAPSPGYATVHVLPDDLARYAGELAVSVSSGLVLAVAPGEAWSDGIVGSVRGGTVTCVPDVTHPRRAKVYIDGTGTIGIVHGVAGSAAIAPVLAAGRVGLATVYIAAAATSVSSGNITDIRVIGPSVGTDNIQPTSVTSAKLSKPVVLPELTITSWTGSGPYTIDVTIDSKDMDGETLADTFTYLVTQCHAGGAPVDPVNSTPHDASVVTGTLVEPTNPASLTTNGGVMVRSNSSGVAKVRFSDASPTRPGYWVRVERLNGPGCVVMGDLPGT